MGRSLAYLCKYATKMLICSQECLACYDAKGKTNQSVS